MEDSYYKNWSLNVRRAKEKPLSDIFPFGLNENGGRIEIYFRNAEGNVTEFHLNVEHSKLFKMNYDRFILKKEGTKRSDYGLEEIE
jgi:hypothetical protein